MMLIFESTTMEVQWTRVDDWQSGFQLQHQDGCQPFGLWDQRGAASGFSKLNLIFPYFPCQRQHHHWIVQSKCHCSWKHQGDMHWRWHHNEPVPDNRRSVQKEQQPLREEHSRKQHKKKFLEACNSMAQTMLDHFVDTGVVTKLLFSWA